MDVENFLSEREKAILALKKEGQTLTSIATQLNISRARVTQILNKITAKGKLQLSTNPYDKMSTRARNFVRVLGYYNKPTVELKEAILNKDFNPTHVPALGKKTFKEICDFVGVETSLVPKQKEVRVAVRVEGCIVQEILCDDPDIVLDVLIYDYDIQGCEYNELSDIVQEDGTLKKAYVRRECAYNPVIKLKETYDLLDKEDSNDH